jgi:methionyl-tRNA formyltransferase
MRVVFMGTPAFVLPVLDVLRSMAGLEVVGVVCPPDRARGRGRLPEPPPVKGYALECGIPVFQPASFRSEAARAELAAFAPDVVVVAAYGRLLPREVLDLPRHGCLNLHPSLLPSHRGPTPVPTAILEADTRTGVSLMLLDEGMDTGPVIARAEVTLHGRETSEGLTGELFHLGAGLLQANLGSWVRRELIAEVQDDSQATVTRKLEREDGLADWEQPAEVLDRRRRAYSPWPGLYTRWDGKVVKLLDTYPLPGLPREIVYPGQVVSAPLEDATPLAIATAEGLLGVYRLQMEGRRAVSAKEFLSGFPGIIGATFC